MIEMAPALVAIVTRKSASILPSPNMTTAKTPKAAVTEYFVIVAKLLEIMKRDVERYSSSI